MVMVVTLFGSSGYRHGWEAAAKEEAVHWRKRRSRETVELDVVGDRGGSSVGNRGGHGMVGVESAGKAMLAAHQKGHLSIFLLRLMVDDGWKRQWRLGLGQSSGWRGSSSDHAARKQWRSRDWDVHWKACCWKMMPATPSPTKTRLRRKMAVEKVGRRDRYW
ncbi:hypothetical protein GW17_00048699 [Ensete ventricosum]|nr:hypothetical protein GW17_00048699 [Ensete ventricosum]